MSRANSRRHFAISARQAWGSAFYLFTRKCSDGSDRCQPKTQLNSAASSPAQFGLPLYAPTDITALWHAVKLDSTCLRQSGALGSETRPRKRSRTTTCGGEAKPAHVACLALAAEQPVQGVVIAPPRVCKLNRAAPQSCTQLRRHGRSVVRVCDEVHRSATTRRELICVHRYQRPRQTNTETLAHLGELCSGKMSAASCGKQCCSAGVRIDSGIHVVARGGALGPTRPLCTPWGEPAAGRGLGIPLIFFKKSIFSDQASGGSAVVCAATQRQRWRAN